jgi:mono/diheme cytochrome c family protein
VQLVLLAGCTVVKPFTDDGPHPDDGRAVYLRACASCHGEDARGWGPVAPTLRVPPSDLTTLRARRGAAEFPRDEIIALVSGERDVPAHGTREMPVWSQRFGTGAPGAAAAFYARRRLEALVDYLAVIQRD